jgi:arylsulfatase A-like enzyme
MVRLVEQRGAMRVTLPRRSVPEATEQMLEQSGYRVRGEPLELPCHPSILFPALRVQWWLCRTRFPVSVEGRSEFRAMVAEAGDSDQDAPFAVERAGVALPRGAIKQAEALDTWIPTRRGFSLPAPTRELRGPRAEELLVDYPVDPEFVSSLDPSHAGDVNDFVVREVSIAGDLRPALYAPAPSELRFPVLLPPDAQLSLALGVLEEGWFLSDGVTFAVSLRFADGSSEVLFEKGLDARAHGAHRRWLEVQLDLSEHSGRRAELLLTTAPADGGDASFGFGAFGSPVLYSRQRDATPVVIVNLDTLRADHLEVYGYGRDTSPALSAFAQDAVVFEQAIAQAPWTLPSQLSILTGLYPASHGVRGLDQRLGTGLETLASTLARAGYLTRAIGDGGAMSSEFGFAHGFDSYGQAERHRDDYVPDLLRRFRHWFDVWDADNFFLLLHTYEPHEPYAPPKADLERYDRDYTGTVFERFSHQGGKTRFEATEREREHLVSRYDGEIRYTDRAFGEIVEMLKTRGLYERALIVVLSDHGEEFGDHGGWQHGHSFYDELLRVPLLIKFPKGRIGPRRVSEQVEMIDVMPTLLDFLELPAPEGLDGRSLLPLLREPRDPDWASADPYAISDRKASEGVSVRTSQYKLVQMQGKRSFYHLEADPGETRDRYDPDDPTVREFVSALEDYLARRPAPGANREAGVPASEVQNQLRALGYLE